MKRVKRKLKRKNLEMKFSILFSIISLFFLGIVLTIALFFIQLPQDLRQRAAGPITYGTCVGPAGATQAGNCYAQPNSCLSQGLTEYYNAVVPQLTQCGQKAFIAGVASGTTISCCPNAPGGYPNSYGSCGATNQGTCTTSTCVGTPLYTDTVPTQCSYNGSQAALSVGTRMYCCSPIPSPTVPVQPQPTPTIVPCGGNQCGVNYSCGPVVTVSGRVVDITTGNGVSGLSLTIYNNNKHNNPGLYARYTDTVMTNTTGNFSETALVCGGMGINYGDAYAVIPNWGACIPGYTCSNPNPVALNGMQANKPGAPDCAKNASCNFSVTLTKNAQANFSFSLSGIGVGGNKNPNNKTRSFQLYFSPHQFASALLARNTQQQVLAAQVIRVPGTATYSQATGSFQAANISINGVPSGQYDVILHVDGSLDKFLQPVGGGTYFTIANGQTINPISVSLSVGDIAPPPSGDNFVDIQDYNALITCLNNVNCQNKTLADINDDGIIDATDLQLLMQSFGQLGDSFSTPIFGCVLDPNCRTGGGTLQFCQLLCKIQ